MPPLPDAVRRLCSGLALVSLVLGIATMPLSVRSAANSSLFPRTVASIARGNAVSTVVPIQRNPFQSDPTPFASRAQAFPRTTAPVTNPMPSRGYTLPTVSALAIGTHPSAVLLEENGVSRIRGIGDRVGSHAIVAISLDGVRLDDGTLLVMTTGAESPSPAPRADTFPAIPIGAQPLPDVRGDTR